jgi:hypothetical protein
MKPLSVLLAASALTLAGCTMSEPLQPVRSTSTTTSNTARGQAASQTVRRTGTGRPEYEQAYVLGHTVTINAIEVPPVAPEKAQADFYEVAYPIGWQNLGIGTPQCNPCDHQGDGIDFSDYHDHVLDSMPSSPGHGEYKAPWHVYVVIPAYNGDAAHDAQVNTAYAAHIPAKSEAEVDALLDSRLPSGAPVAVEIDTHFYFLCAVVSPNAMP